MDLEDQSEASNVKYNRKNTSKPKSHHNKDSSSSTSEQNISRRPISSRKVYQRFDQAENISDLSAQTSQESDLEMKFSCKTTINDKKLEQQELKVPSYGLKKLNKPLRQINSSKGLYHYRKYSENQQVKGFQHPNKILKIQNTNLAQKRQINNNAGVFKSLQEKDQLIQTLQSIPIEKLNYKNQRYSKYRKEQIERRQISNTLRYDSSEDAITTPKYQEGSKMISLDLQNFNDSISDKLPSLNTNQYTQFSQQIESSSKKHNKISNYNLCKNQVLSPRTLEEIQINQSNKIRLTSEEVLSNQNQELKKQDMSPLYTLSKRQLTNSLTFNSKNKNTQQQSLQNFQQVLLNQNSNHSNGKKQKPNKLR